MRKIVLFVGFQLLFILKLYANTDSTGVKYINGKLFVLHKVEKGQGLYGIARRYGSSVAKIEEANPAAKSGIKAGDIIMVPYSKTVKTSEETAEKKAPKKTVKPREPENTETTEKVSTTIPPGKDPIYHVVTPKETLYQIAVNHKLTEAQVKAWNNNLEGGLIVGDKIIVGYKAKTSSKPKAEKKAEKPVKTKTQPTAKKQTESLKQDYDNTSKNTVKKEVQENGMGSWVDDGSIKSEVNLAMHKTAPVGTIIRLKNPMNGKIKYVKVIDKLPDTEDNANILIKIGKNTADELDIRDKNFRVEMTYSVEVEK